MRKQPSQQTELTITGLTMQLVDITTIACDMYLILECLWFYLVSFLR